MSDLFKRNRKKFTIAFAILLVVYLILLAYAIITKSKPTDFTAKTTGVYHNGKTEDIQTKSQADGLPQRNPLALNKTYQQSRFSVTYPELWRVSRVPFKSGEEVIFEDEFFPKKPRLVVDAYDYKASASAKIELYVTEGFMKTETTIKGRPATELRATMPYRMSSAKIIPGPMQQVVIFMPTETKLYAFKYYYDGTVSDPVFEKLFADMINSIQIP